MATDNLTILDTNYINVTGIKVRGTGNGMLTYVRPQGTKTITENGTDIDVTEYASIDVDVDNAVDGSAYQDEDGFIVLGDGESSAPQGTITITENGTTNVSSYASAQINVTPNLQSKIATPTTSQQIISADDGYDGLSQITISSIPSPKDVTFRDYDGTIVTSYTKEEFAELTEMPANPSHEKLIAQGWNWTFEKAQSYVAKYGRLEIGQMYTTASGNTEIDVTFDDPELLSPYLAIGIDGTATIDWGDGSATQTITGSNGFTEPEYTQHIYTQIGNYTISISGSIVFLTDSSYTSAILRDTTNIDNNRNVYANCIKAIRIGALAQDLLTNSFYSLNLPSLKTITIPNNVYIGKKTFSGCSSLTSIVIPFGVTGLAQSLWSNSGFKNIVLPETITLIEPYEFSECRDLTFIAIPEGVTSIGEKAFYNCYSLTSIIIPDSVTTIGKQAFYQCYNLKSVTLSNNITNIGEQAFNSCTNLRSIDILNDTTQINTNAITETPSLKAFVDPSKVKQIGSSAFNNCLSLTSAIIPNNIEFISQYAFEGDYFLTSVTIPDSVTRINTYAFAYCYSVLEYHLLPTTPPTLVNTNTFDGITSGTKIYVPTASLEAYKTATNWSTYANYMEGE